MVKIKDSTIASKNLEACAPVPSRTSAHGYNYCTNTFVLRTFGVLLYNLVLKMN